MSLSPQFISVENMRMVLDRLQYELPSRDRSGLATAAISSIGSNDDIPPVKRVVYDLMVDVVEDTDFATTTTATKNDVVVDAAIEYFSEVAKALRLRPIERTTRGTSAGPGPRESAIAETPTGDGRRETREALSDMQTYVDDPFAPAPSGARVLNSSDVLMDKAGGNSDDNIAGQGASASDQNMVVVRRCMSLDGQDRDVTTWRSRYSYSTHFDEALKQVQEVSVAAVVVPLQDHTVNAPFLLLALEELSGLYSYNRNDAIRKSFAKLIPESSYASSHGRTYVVLKPAFDDSVHYSPVLPTLSRLTSQLIRPDGMLVSSCEDTLRVIKITQSSDGNWILEFDRFWPTKEFGRGDIVCLRECHTGVDAVDQHINRHAGHEVLEIGRPLADEGCNKIMIRFAGNLDKSTGNYVKDPKAEPAFDGSHANSNAVGEINVSCSAMNMSLQMSITMMVKCLEPAAPDTQSM
jgi:hypothetical protein